MSKPSSGRLFKEAGKRTRIQSDQGRNQTTGHRSKHVITNTRNQTNRQRSRRTRKLLNMQTVKADVTHACRTAPAQNKATSIYARTHTQQKPNTRRTPRACQVDTCRLFQVVFAWGHPQAHHTLDYFYRFKPKANFRNPARFRYTFPSSGLPGFACSAGGGGGLPKAGKSGPPRNRPRPWTRLARQSENGRHFKSRPRTVARFTEYIYIYI